MDFLLYNQLTCHVYQPKRHLNIFLCILYRLNAFLTVKPTALEQCTEGRQHKWQHLCTLPLT